MSFLNEKQSRWHFLYVLLFTAGLFCLGIFGVWMYGQKTKEVVLERERELASSLLEQGVKPEVAAAAFKSSSVTEEGDAFLQSIGQTERTLLWLRPAVWQTVLELLGIMMAVLSVCGFVLILGTFLFLRRREQLYKDASDIIMQFAEGNFQNRLPRNQTGTLYLLFSSIDQLATALQAKNDTEHRAKEFLKDTISDISHQLKTPLAALNMYTEIISGEPENPGTVREFSQKSMRSLERMEQLIQSLLKVMRLDAGSISFEKRICPVTEVISRALDNLHTRAEKEGKKFILKGDRDETIYCDPGWTAEAVGNLVKNALDHTAFGGIISIEWQHSPAMQRILVSDNGCGISPEDIHHIFKRFYRSRNSSDRQGVGLGLPLAKAVIEGQGGLLSVQSKPGEGTRFTISFLTEL